MLSDLIISSQRFVFVIDEVGQEKIAQNLFRQLLTEQNQNDSTIKTLLINELLTEQITFNSFVEECNEGSTQKWNVILPPLSDLLCYQRPSEVFKLLNSLCNCAQIKRTFLWASSKLLIYPYAQYLLAAFEYFADIVLRLETPTELVFIARKPSGGITNQRYVYKRTEQEFLVETKSFETELATEKKIESPKITQLGTFKIELDEEELVARNAVQLPYERNTIKTESNIVYTLDNVDDIDEEDPDEDLCV